LLTFFVVVLAAFFVIERAMMASENNQPTATLFHIPFGSSSRVVNIIHELGIENKVAVEILPSWAETKSEWYLKLHPQGKVELLD
jgi:hypothetical protein